MRSRDPLQNITNPAALKAFAEGDIDNALVAATPGGIERQEREGQQALVDSMNFPRRMSPDQAVFEKVGLIFGDNVDALFRKVVLPAGWSRQPAEHSYYTRILDDRGRTRIDIFYKAAFYDRRADARLLRRYDVGTQYPGDNNDVPRRMIRAMLLDSGKPFRVSADIAYDDHTAYGVVEAAMKATLDKEFPQWMDPTAYWDDA